MQVRDIIEVIKNNTYFPFQTKFKNILLNTKYVDEETSVLY